jgi:hypothetical protein
MKKVITLIILLINILFIQNVFADEMEFIAGIEHQDFDEHNDYDNTGISSRFRYLRYRSGSNIKHGFFGNLDFPAIAITVFNATAGYGLRTGGNFFFETALGLSYSPIYSSGVIGTLGIGYRAGGKWYLSFPAHISSRGISITPMIGYKF